MTLVAQTSAHPRRKLRSQRASETGATVIEYSLIAALIALVAFVAMQSTGVKLRGTYEHIDNKITSITP